MQNDRKRTRSMYEDDEEFETFSPGKQTGTETNQWNSRLIVPPSTPANWASPGNGSVFNFDNSVGSSSCYQFGSSTGNNYGKNFAKWNEVEDSEEWGVEGVDWEWEIQEEYEGEEFEDEETSDSQWNSYDNFEEEGYDSVG